MNDWEIEAYRAYGIENEALVREYCDLTPARWGALWEAVLEPPVLQLNGAMRQAMGGMINTARFATPYGQAVYRRAIEVMQNGRPKGAQIRELMLPVQAARKVRLATGRMWVRTPHVKLLVNLARAPGQAYKWVAQVFSYAVVDQLLDVSWIWGRNRAGWPIVLSDLGYDILGSFTSGGPEVTPLEVAALMYNSQEVGDAE